MLQSLLHAFLAITTAVVTSKTPCSRGGCEFDRVDVRGISADYLDRAVRPLVLYGFDDWFASNIWSSSRTFADAYGAHSGFARDHDQLEIRDWDATVDGYLAGVGVGNLTLPTSAAFFVNDFEDSQLLDSIRKDHGSPHFLQQNEGLRVFSLERPGAGVAFHRHEQAWQAQLIGSKMWFLVGPDMDTLPQGRPCAFVDNSETPPLAECCLVNAGEIMRLPNQWWHATCSSSTEPSVAIGGVASTRGWPPAHAAARQGNITALELMHFGHSRFPKSHGILQEGDEPLIAAVAFGHLSAASLILERRADPNAQRTDGGVALHEAVRRGDLKMAELLHAHGANLLVVDAMGCTVLHHACRGRGARELIEYLLAHGLKAGARCQDDRTPVHDACLGHPDPVAKLRLLLGTSQVSPSPTDHKGITPLALCAASGHARGVGLLLKLGGKDVLHRSDMEGRLALDHAVSGRADAGVVRRLLDAGSAVTEKHVQAAVRSGEVETVQLLLAMGGLVAGSLLEAARAGHLAMVSALVQHVHYDERHIDDKASSLHIASLEGHLSVVNFLLDLRASVTAEDGEGLLPLHYAAMSFGRARLPRQQEIMQLLVQESGNHWDVSDKRGATALHFTAATGDAQLARWLAFEKKVIDPCSKDIQGNTASALAETLNHSSLAKSLDAWCAKAKSEL